MGTRGGWRATAWRLAAALSVMMALFWLGNAAQTASAQDGGTLSVRPSKTQVAAGESFNVDIYQDSPIATLGAQTSVFFDPNVLQIVSLSPGPDYEAASISAGVAPQSVDDAIAEANSTGALFTIYTFYLPGTGSVPPGETLFVRLGMKAKAGGTSNITLGEHVFDTIDPISGAPGTDTDIVGVLPDPPDAFGTLLGVNTQNSSVTVTGVAPGATTPATSGSGTPSPTPKGSPRPSRTPRPSGATAGPITMSITPETLELVPGETGALKVVANTSEEITGATFNLKFNRQAITIDSIEVGDGWRQPPEGGFDTAIEAANTGGELAGLAVLLKAGDDPLDGEVEIATITFKGADKDASSNLELTEARVLDADGNEIDAESRSGSAVVGEGGGGGGGGSALLFIFGGLAVVGALGGGGYLTYRQVNQRKRWE